MIFLNIKFKATTRITVMVHHIVWILLYFVLHFTLLKICNHINSRVTLGVNINMVRVIVNPNANH